MTEAAEQKQEGARSFTRFIDQIDEGAATADLSQEMHKLVHAMQMHARRHAGKAKGEMTVKLRFNMEKHAIAVAYEVKRKEPEPPRATDMFFITKGGNISREDPRQQSLPLREVPNNDDTREIEDDAQPARNV